MDLVSPAYASSNDDEDFDDEDFEEENSIQICCSWGNSLEDGELTYHIDDDDMSEEQQDAIQNVVEEWDTEIEPLELEEESRKRTSDIVIELDENNDEEEDMAGQTITIANEDGFLLYAQITIYEEVEGFEFDTQTIEQVAKHEMGHALGLGHANFDANLMAEKVNYGTTTISECEVEAVIEANHWKLEDDDTHPDSPRHDSISC